MTYVAICQPPWRYTGTTRGMWSPKCCKHHQDFSRVELIIVRGADEIRRIDLTDESHRERVLAVKTKEHLALLYDEFA